MRKVKAGHFRAVGHGELGKVLGTIRQSNGMKSVRLALQFAIFTAARSGEVRGATWGEIEGDTWTIPASRMKGGRTHRVALSLQARLVLQEAKALGGRTENDLVFPHTGGRELSQSCLPLRCRKLGLATTPTRIPVKFPWMGASLFGGVVGVNRTLPFSHQVLATAYRKGIFPRRFARATPPDYGRVG